MPLLEHNIDANARFFPENMGTRPRAMILDWDDDTIPTQIQNISRQRGLDAIVMADVTYNTASFPSLVHTLSNLIKLCEKSPLVLLGYKERDTAERTLWEMVHREASIDLALVGQMQGAGGAPIEIWIGHAIES
ncbi:hypothetical protein AX15_003551 [Amanita polypyramis BW_CC]|nr:hypothetical protein AX15_003551 [Amanita polypyramis BW_CC]